ncbi:beta-1,6-N-acetylglucosaminyltransferase [Frigoribacterium sp. 2-23]|uniref:beta-1,6-N-acetylglucosaminyltransferase n=1 Tax=Frigoribacterium sp. 2-23 TaxID=3415006 RepID=UPI003C6F07D6
MRSALPENQALLPSDDGAPDATLACVVLAHADPTHLHRLVDALDPFPVFVHCDARTPDEVYDAMADGLPARARMMSRLRTGWARFENVEAEIEGYRLALETTDVTHVALLTGSDYPIASSVEIAELLAEHVGESFAYLHALPHPEWRAGGYGRLRYRHWAWNKRMLRLPVPRRLPTGVVFAGGSQLKVLARHHAQAVVDAYDQNPDLVAFWRRSWVADETFVASILKTPRFVPHWEDELVTTSLWFIGWDGRRRKSPPWLTTEAVPALLTRRTDPRIPTDHVFARKFTTGTTDDVLDVLDDRFALRGPARDELRRRMSAAAPAMSGPQVPSGPQGSSVPQDESVAPSVDLPTTGVR